MTSYEDLRDFDVAFTMHAGSRERRFTMTVPALDQEHAEKAAFGIALGINDGSGHVWKIGQDPIVSEATR